MTMQLEAIFTWIKKVNLPVRFETVHSVPKFSGHIGFCSTELLYIWYFDAIDGNVMNFEL